MSLTTALKVLPTQQAIGYTGATQLSRRTTDKQLYDLKFEESYSKGHIWQRQRRRCNRYKQASDWNPQALLTRGMESGPQRSHQISHIKQIPLRDEVCSSKTGWKTKRRRAQERHRKATECFVAAAKGGKELRSHQPSQRRPGTEPFPGLTTKSRSRVSQEETFYLHCRRARVLKERRINCTVRRYNWSTQLRERAKKVAKEVLHGSCLSKRRGLSQSNQRKINRTSANYRKISWDEALEKWLCSWRAWQFWHLRREKRRWMSL